MRGRLFFLSKGRFVNEQRCVFLFLFIIYLYASKMHWAAGEDQGASRGGQRGLTAGGNSAGWVIVGFSGGRERVTQVRPSLRELSGKLLGRGRVAGPWCHGGGGKQLIKASASFFFLSPQVMRFNGGGRGDGRAEKEKTRRGGGGGGQ